MRLTFTNATGPKVNNKKTTTDYTFTAQTGSLHVHDNKI